MKRTVLQLVVFVATGWVMSANTYGADMPPEAILTQASYMCQNLQSVQFSAKQKLELTDFGMRAWGASKKEYLYEMTFAEQNGNFRSDFSCEDWGTGQRVRSLSLFDGDRYQVYDPQRGILTISKHPRTNNTSISVNPLLLPYVLLFEAGGMQSLSELRRPDFWDKVRLRASSYASEKDDNHEYAILSLPRTEDEVTLVYFAKDLNYFPLKSRVQTKGNVIAMEINVVDYQRYGADAQLIVVPRTSTWSIFDETGSKAFTLEVAVDANTLKINEPVD